MRVKKIFPATTLFFILAHALAAIPGELPGLDYPVVKESMSEPVGGDFSLPSRSTIWPEKPKSLDLESQKNPVETSNVDADKPDKVHFIFDYSKLVLITDKVQGGSYTNLSPHVTWVKGERSDQVYPVPSGVTYPWSVDAFADPTTKPGEVYKVIDNMHTHYEIVDNNPIVSFTPDSQQVKISPAHKVLQSLHGGWKDENWHRELQAKPDYGWDNLFQVSRPYFATFL